VSIQHNILQKDGTDKEVSLTPNRAIKAKCMECSNWSYAEVKICAITNCSLHPFRFGKNPGAKRDLTDEQRAELRLRGLALSKLTTKKD